MENKQKKWIYACILMILAGVLGYYIPVFVYYISGPFYSRENMDKIIYDMFGDAKITEALTDEVLILGYSFDLK
jgi:hypothetical protein